MAELYIIFGESPSGKSIRAKEVKSVNPNAVIVDEVQYPGGYDRVIRFLDEDKTVIAVSNRFLTWFAYPEISRHLVSLEQRFFREDR